MLTKKNAVPSNYRKGARWDVVRELFAFRDQLWFRSNFLFCTVDQPTGSCAAVTSYTPYTAHRDKTTGPHYPILLQILMKFFYIHDILQVDTQTNAPTYSLSRQPCKGYANVAFLTRQRVGVEGVTCACAPGPSLGL